jgi:hypothetical protein
MESAGLFTIYHFNGKDLFLQAPDESFVVKSVLEMPLELRERAHEWIGRKIQLSADGSFTLVSTPKELDEARARTFRHVNILRDIAALEADEKNLPEYAQRKLKELRDALAEFEPRDPTAISLESKRSLASWQRPAHQATAESLKFVTVPPVLPTVAEKPVPSPSLAVPATVPAAPVTVAEPSQSFFGRLWAWLPDYARDRLAALRAELATYEPLDPTARNLEQQRATSKEAQDSRWQSSCRKETRNVAGRKL